MRGTARWARVVFRRTASIALAAIGLAMMNSAGCIWIEPQPARPVPGYGSTFTIEGAPAGALSGHPVLVMAINREWSTICKVDMQRINRAGCVTLQPLQNRTLVGSWAMCPMLIDGVYLYRGTWVTPNQTLISPLIPGYVPVRDGEKQSDAWVPVDGEAYISSREPKQRRIVVCKATRVEEVDYLLRLAEADLAERSLDVASLKAAEQAQLYARRRLDCLGYGTHVE